VTLEAIVEGFVTAIEILDNIQFFEAANDNCHSVPQPPNQGIGRVVRFPRGNEFSETFEFAARPFDFDTGQGKVWSDPFQPRKEQPARALTHDLVPHFRSDTAHLNRATASDRKSLLLLSCNSSLSKRTERSSAGARSAWNLALRRGVLAGASIRFFLLFRAIANLRLPRFLSLTESNRITLGGCILRDAAVVRL
jgi:hypothetical protein